MPLPLHLWGGIGGGGWIAVFQFSKSKFGVVQVLQDTYPFIHTNDQILAIFPIHLVSGAGIYTVMVFRLCHLLTGRFPSNTLKSV